MKNCLFNKAIVFFIFVYLLSCDHGISPDSTENKIKTITGIAGTVYYQNWPPVDSLFDLRIVIFKDYPPADIVGEVTNGDAIAFPDISLGSLPFFVDSTNFTIELEPIKYEYIVLAQQYGPALFFDWRVAGQFDTTLNDTIPTSVEVFNDTLIKGINIFVDFDSLPGQPF